MGHFEKCKYAESCGYEFCPCEECIDFEAKVMTNADRIRSMTDEELARLLIFWNDDWGRWETDAGCIDAYDPMDSIEEAIKAEVEWLKQPAEVE